jgi:Asp-tRNA(Asn)/Glu-tRNA(Gln) amidotransferase A subunit family amidase
VDKTGVWPVSGEFFETWNGIGPLARSVRDVRLAYNIITRQSLPTPAAVTGLRLIVPNGFRLKYKTPCIKNAYLDAQEKLQTAGLNLEHHNFSDVPKLYLNIPRLITGEMIEPWTEWLSSNGEKFKPASELIRQVLGQPTVYPGFFLWFVMAPLMRPRRLSTLSSIIQDYETARNRYYGLLSQDGILILPTLGLLAPKHRGMNRFLLRPGVNGLFTAETFANYINLSAITLPAHRHADPVTGLKPGIMLACTPGAEARLLDVAAQLEIAI